MPNRSGGFHIFPFCIHKPNILSQTLYLTKEKDKSWVGEGKEKRVYRMKKFDWKKLLKTIVGDKIFYWLAVNNLWAAIIFLYYNFFFFNIFH